jgi:hypothetical protein
MASSSPCSNRDRVTCGADGMTLTFDPCPDDNICTVVARKAACVPLWSQQVGSSGDDIGKSIAIDGTGNLYVTGSAQGALEGNDYAGGDDIFIAKYNGAVEKQWIVELGTKYNESGTGVAADQDGNVYVTGVTQNELDGNKSAGADDIFVVKYDASGQKQWTRQLGTKDYEAATGIAADGAGDVYVTGWTKGNLDGNTNAGGFDSLVVKYDASGQKQWMRQFGTIYDDQSAGIAVDNEDNVYIAGSTTGKLGDASAGAVDIFIVKYDGTGDKKWTQQLGTEVDDYAKGIAVDGLGHVYVTGSTNGNLDSGYGANKGKDIFVVQYDSTGEKHWIHTVGTPNTSSPNVDDVGYGVATDRTGNVYVTGFTGGMLPASATESWGEAPPDMFVIKYDGEGVGQWTRQYGTISEDEGFGIASDGDGNLYVTGYTGYQASGKQPRPDVFVARYNNDGNRW